MFRIAKINDTTLGHAGACAPCPGVATIFNSNVYSEDVLVSVESDVFNPHPTACHGSVDYAINSTTCSPNVFVNDLKVTIEGSFLFCGDQIFLNPINEIKTQVFVNSIF